MNKSELVDAIAAGADISKAAAGKALDAAIDTITAAVAKATR
jgi:DNA-binding protein HU-beta